MDDALSYPLTFLAGGGLGTLVALWLGTRTHALNREKFQYERDADQRAKKEAALTAALAFYDRLVWDANEFIVYGRIPSDDPWLNDHMAHRQAEASTVLRDLNFHASARTETLTRTCFDLYRKAVTARLRNEPDVHEWHTRLVNCVSDCQGFVKKDFNGTFTNEDAPAKKSRPAVRKKAGAR